MAALTITRGSIKLLNEALGIPGIFTEPLKLYRAGMLAERLDHEFGADTEPQENTERRAWHTGRIQLEVTDKETEILKDCIKYHVGRGSLGASQHAMSLLLALGLVTPSDS